MQLFTVDTKLAQRYLDTPLLSGEDVGQLLRHRSIADGTPVYLDEETMLPVEPLCSWAWLLPSHLPQLLLFEQHLENTRRRLPPARFTAVWGQTYTNLRSVLADRSGEEKALARKHIEAGQAALHLPLTAHQEFDR